MIEISSLGSIDDISDKIYGQFTGLTALLFDIFLFQSIFGSDHCKNTRLT